MRAAACVVIAFREFDVVFNSYLVKFKYLKSISATS